MTQEDEPMSVLEPVEIDEQSQVPITRIPDLPVPLGAINNWLKEGRNLKFEVNPVDNSGVIYISANESTIANTKLFPEESKLYSFQIPDSINDDSDEYNEYLESTFKNFEELIKDQTFCDFIVNKVDENRIGVILEEDINARKLQNQDNQLLLNSTISKLISDLGHLIDTKLSLLEADLDDFKLIQLEETMNVLGLINTLFFATVDEFLVLLINWVNRADIQPDLELTELCFAAETPFRHKFFWNEYVMKLVTRGLFAQAVNVINESKYQILETEDENDLILIIEDLIVLLSNYDTVQFSLDNRKFVQWKQKCCELRDNFMNVTINNKANIQIKNNIYEVLLVMTGLQSSIVKNSSTWYECLLAKYLFELPSVSLINKYLESSLEKFPFDELDSLTWERICIDLMHGNYLKVVKGLEVLDKPTSTYVSVLFEAKGLYNSYDQLLLNDGGDVSGRTESISELLLNDHALECLCHQKLIPIGVGILMNLNTSITRSVVSQYLPKYHCKTNDDLEWCLSICAKLKLQSTLSTILIINGNRLFEQGQLYEALTLFSKSGNLSILQDKCWLIFENSLMRSEKIEDELINSLILNRGGDSDLEMSDSLRQCLSPYAILLMFLNLKKQNQTSQPVTYLLKLLSFPYLPQKFFPLLICQLLPFFKELSPSKIDINPANGKILSQDQLIQVLEMINKFDQNFLKPYQQAQQSTKLSLEQQTIFNEFENSQDLYKLCISDQYKKQVKDKQYDWRYQLELINDTDAPLPLNIGELLLYIRHKISLQIGWCFLEEV